MLRKIITWPHEKLRSKSQLIADVALESELVKDLIDTCNVNMGAGLAAPQIGVNKRIVVIKPSAFGKENPDPSAYNADYMVLINPILENAGDELTWNEACLSLPGIDGKVCRSENTLVKYTSETGEEKRLIAEWPFSGGLQHECDHLDGKLFIHRMEKRKAAFLLDKWRRKKRKERIKAKRAARGKL